jgi:pantoate kinase
VGATGGGYILSKGTRTRATEIGVGKGKISTTVNGDAAYNARTTRRAVGLLLAESKKPREIQLDQRVETPIGAGFGASGAGSVSAVYSVADVASIKSTRRKLALFAHRAEIIESTGLGTVSVIFDSAGAGAITVPGEPGTAKFTNVDVPSDTRIVTGYLAPFDKKDALSSKSITEKINSLGRQALNAFMADPSLDTLALEGERFSGNLGLESPEVRKMIETAKATGASYASMNMIGYSVHALVGSDQSNRVAKSLKALSKSIRVDTFEVGKKKAGLVASSRRRPGPS